MRDETRIGRLVALACLWIVPPSRSREPPETSTTSLRPSTADGVTKLISGVHKSVLVVICPQLAISEVKLGFLDFACKVHVKLFDGPLAHTFHHWQGASTVGQDFFLAIQVAAVFAITIHTT